MRKRPSTRASALRETLDIQRKSGARDAVLGGEEDIWVTVARVRAAKFEFVRTFTSNEELRSDVHAAQVIVRFRTRFNPAFSADMRAVDSSGAIYAINGTAEVGSREWTDLICAKWEHEQP